MKKILLCGHTGSINRGCEAIVSSTADILKKCGVDNIELLTFNKNDDIKLGLDKKIKLTPYPEKNIFEKLITVWNRSVLKNNQKGPEITYKKALKNEDNNTICFNVGGDTYCYGTPYMSYALNNEAQKRGIPNVFWGCSVDDTTLEKQDMIDDLNKYSHIVVREKLSEEIFNKCIKDKSKLHKTCDPAFHLEIKEAKLPENFKEGNTLGLNISPLVCKNADDENDLMYQNVFELIDYVIKETEMNVCLIPHVYDYSKNLEDSRTLMLIYKKYKDTKRIAIVKECLNCSELKYIISKCRFFIGARTHSTIAAYSTEVPCIALSYSIKSRGIAVDLFGTDKEFAIPYKNIKEKTELKEKFIKVLLNNEDNIRQMYKNTLPEYKQSIIEETKIILEDLKA